MHVCTTWPFRWVVFVIAFFSAPKAFSTATNNKATHARSSTLLSSGIPITMQGTHRNNTFGLTVTNYGIVGNQANPFGLRDSFDGLPSVSFEYPLGSRIEYLFQGALWVGGIVNGDTLVSVGNDGWIFDPDRGEIHPSSNPGEVTAQKIGGGAQEIIFNYTDTLTDPIFVGQDPADARPHRPLNLSFLQKSFVFSPAAGVDSFAVIYLRLQNVGINSIESLYFGLFMDNDAGHMETPNYFLDDVAGFVDSTLISGTPLQGDIACIWDQDGDPSGGLFRPTSPTGLTGIKLIGSSQPLIKKSFNWWTPNGTVALDWGPQQAPGRLNQSGGRGQPEGDAMKYYYLSNGETDYPQVRSAIDQSSQGWLPPLADPGAAVDIAGGFDARYLVSFGSFDLAPADTLALVFAASIGGNLHINPNNFAANLGATPSNYLNSVRINQYLSGLHFGSLIHNTLLAESLWNTGLQNLVLGPPGGVSFQFLPNNLVRLKLPIPSDLESGFKVYRSIDSVVFSLLSDSLLTGGFYFDTAAVEATRYWYKFSTVSKLGIEGPIGGLTGPVVFGTPAAPSNLLARPLDHNGNIGLTWHQTSDTDLRHFRIYRGAFPGPFVLTLFDSVSAAETAYVDAGTVAGERFRYRVSTVDTFNLESPLSDSVQAMRFVFGNKILLADRTSYRYMRFIAATAARDSLFRFHSRLLRHFDFDTLNLSEDNFGFTVNPTFVTRNPVIVIHSSELNTTNDRDNASFLSFFNDYLRLGGKLIIGGHWPVAVYDSFTLCNYNPIFLPFTTSSTWDTTRSRFGFDCMFFPYLYPLDSSLSSNSFLFAKSNKPNYPFLRADSAKVDLFVLTIQRDHYQYPTLPNIGHLTNRYPSEDLYTFGSIFGFSDPKDGHTIAKKYLDIGAGGGFVWFNFPLFFMQEDSAKKAFRQALADLGVPENFPKADLNRDGLRNIIDITYLLNWVFLGEQFPIFDADEADMNCDKLSSPADVVFLLRNAFLGQNLPC